MINFLFSILFAVTLWVQVPQWDDDWVTSSGCT